MAFEPFPESALNGSVVERFEDVARRHAARLAVSDGTRSFTYAELSVLAGRVAGSVAALTDGRAGPVAIVLANEARYPAAMFGTLAVGRAYVPLDSGHPIERNRLIAAHAGAVAVLSAGAVVAQARALFPPGMPVCDLDELHEAGRARRELRPGPDHIAYITYTSGSTGAPKGVYQNHRGLLQDIQQSTNSLRLSSEDRLCMFYSPSLVHGTRISLGALLNGASVHMLPPRELMPAGLAREIRARGISVFRAVPALFRRVVETLAEGERLDSLRLVYLGGDRVGWHDFDAFTRGCAPHAVMATHLGSTECSIFLQWQIDAGERQPGALLPVGRPLPDRQVALLDAAGRAVADGEAGEFVVTSRYIALGYWNDPERSARAFATDPADPAARRFRTGDIGRRRPDGLFEFLGRGDQQVKLHGHRIEPGEVEGILESLSGVRDAAVVVRRDRSGAVQALVAHVELKSGISGLLPRHLLSMASRAMPGYMVPAAIYVGELPRLANFKLDRAALAGIDAALAARPSVRGDDPLLDAVLAVFEGVIGVSGATPEDNVRTLGGDSLQSVEIAAVLQERFGMAIPAESFEAQQTIGDLARWIHERRS